MICCALLPITSCSKYDDTTINERVDKIEERVGALETLVSQLNSSLSGLVTSIDALNNQDKIVSITRTPGDDGWNIVFEKAGTISVYDGKNGVNGVDGATHQIGVRKDDDGLYYWTIDGEWLIQDDAKVPATAQVVVPQIKIEDGKFLFSTDGTKWTIIGDAGTSGVGIVSDVVDYDDKVVFTLSDGYTFTIPKVQDFELCIDYERSSLGIENGMAGFFYEIKGADENTILKVFPCEGCSYEVTDFGNNSGVVEINVDNGVVNAEILVMAINSRGVVSGKVVTIEEGVLKLVENSYSIGPEGGIVSIKVETNVNYNPDYKDKWISYVQTKAPHVEEVQFQVQPNPGTSERTATVRITNTYGTVTLEATIVQAGNSSDGPTLTTGGEADFDTFVGDAIDPSPVSRNAQTTNGWEAKNVYLTETTYKWKSLGLGHIVPALSGDKREIGVLTSPMIEGGCGNLTIEWGTFSNSSWRPDDISATVDVMDDNKNIVDSFVVSMDKNEIVEETVYTYKKTLNQSGPCYLKITNNSTTTSALNSTFAIVSVSWTGYSE